MRRGSGWLLLLIVVVAGFLVWRANSRADRAERRQEKAEFSIAENSSRVLSETFARTKQLKVATLNGVITANSTKPGWINILNTSQTTRVPFSVEYFVDLSNVDQKSYRWDQATKTMFVELPEVVVGPPNVDATRAQTQQGGLWIGRRDGLELQRKVSLATAIGAKERAALPNYVEEARRNARVAIEQQIAAPLKAAGLGNVRAVVRFPTDGRRSGERWDESRPLSDVLAETR